MLHRQQFSLTLFAIFLLVSCTTTEIKKTTAILSEVKIQPIKLKGDLRKRRAEISGLSWYGNNLILLPQFPNRFSDLPEGKIYFIKKERILSYISGKDTTAIQPKFYTINTNEFAQLFGKGSGFEAVTFINDTIFFTIESVKFGKTVSYIISGKIDSVTKTISLNKETLKQIPNKLNILNMGNESILAYNNKVIPIYEANGKNINPHPTVTVFNTKASLVGTLTFPNIEYRITDVTSPDTDNTFWAINYFYPGEKNKLKPAEDKIAKKYGLGKSHLKTDYVERLIQFKIDSTKIKLTNTPPVYIYIPDSGGSNWEGIVKLGKKGFLIVTDMYPKTILGFVKRF